MKKRYVVFICVCIIALLNGCGEKQDAASDQNKQTDAPVTNIGQSPPVIDHLDTYPFPVPSAWKEEKFEVRKYDEGMDWEAVFTFDGDVTEEATAYKEVMQQLGYEIQSLLSDVFKIGTAELAGVIYHGTFTFSLGDQYSEWGEGQGYVQIVFSEKK